MNSTDQLCNFEATKIPQPQPQPQPHGERKKQVRRRRQSRRLYKQMPLNMAEARREIATALKLHRASTKEAKEQQQKQDQQIKHSLPMYPHQFTPCFEPERRMKSRRNPRIYPDCSFYFENGSDFIAPPPVAQSLHLDIPIQTLGLNPNFEDTSSVVCSNNNNNHSFYSLSFLPPSSYICPTFDYAATTTHQEVPKSISLSEEEGRLMASDLFWSNNFPTGESEKEIHGAVEEEEEEEEAMVAEIRSVDEKPLEIDGQTHCTFENVPTGQSEEAMEFPDWLSINDDFLQPRSNYQFSNEDYLQDPDLSCMDIGEIEDVDGDWLA